MFRMTSMMTLFSIIFLSVAQAQEVEIASLEVRVEGIKDQKGEIGVALFNHKLGYPTHLEHAYETEWVPLQEGQKTADVVFDTIPPGEYAVSVVHDTNGNRLVDRSRLGFPKEGVGFSNDQKVTLRAPRFENAKMALSAGENKKIVIKLDYRD